MRARARFRRTSRALASGIAAWLALGAAGPAAADVAPEPPVEVDKKGAASAFAAGEKAFASGDYLRAAESFEQANRLAPHPANVWNAARAYHKLGELARAANLYSKYLRTAPADSPDRDGATSALRELTAKLGRLDVYAPGARDLAVDGHPFEGESVYVVPGSHVVTGAVDNRSLSRDATVDAGASLSVALVESKPPPAPAPIALPPAPPSAPVPVAPAPNPPAPVAKPNPGLRVLPPAVFYAGAGLTAVAGAFMIASGVDTLNARSDFLAAPTTPKLQDGKGKELRTNVLIGVTTGLGALTTATTLFFVDFHSATQETKIGLSPTSLSTQINF